jgi:hypothetical protein
MKARLRRWKTWMFHVEHPLEKIPARGDRGQCSTWNKLSKVGF